MPDNSSESTRRSFLKSTAAAGAATMLAGSLAFGEQTTNKKIRIGIVGGNFGLQFFFHDHPNCTVGAVSDLRPERRAALMKTYRCENSYESLEKLVLDDEIDAVAIFTGAPDHVRHVELAMKHGKHALSAVPAACGSLDECHRLLDVVKSTGLTYMMAETSYYQQPTISARKFYQEHAFGRIFYAESEYHHPGLGTLGIENGKRTWRYGYAPMHYPTHCTAHLIGVTRERLTHVSCIGWGDDIPMLKDNSYNNPFWGASALFQSERGTGFRVSIWWSGAERGCERAQLYGEKMSFFWPNPNGLGSMMAHATQLSERDSAGFARMSTSVEPYKQPNWWATDMLPEKLRHDSGHEGSHTFLTHEFVDALVNNRKPTVDVHEALAYTAPGIIAQQSALKGGERLSIPSFDS